MAFDRLIAMALLLSLMAALATAHFDNPKETCQQEVLETDLQNCRKFMMKRGSEMLMSIANQDIQEKCCSDLKKVKSECRCDVIKEIMWDMQEEIEYGKVGSKTMKKMMGIAAKLPSICGMSPDYCHFEEI